MEFGLNTLYDVFSGTEALFDGRDETAAHLGGQIPPNPILRA